MVATANISLQRTAPYGLAAELGSLCVRPKSGLIVCGVIWLSALVGCSRALEVQVGEQVRADIIVLFKLGTQGATINDFLTRTLPPSHDSSGNYRPVILSELFIESHGYAGYAITFQESASEATRQAVVRSIRQSPIVYRVFLNRRPDSISPREVDSHAAA